jgi:hypothetical protein
MLNEGNFEISGTPDELRASANPVVKKFTEEALSPGVHERIHNHAAR